MLQIGFMQGRLVDMVNEQIQAFPWRDWEKEINLAYENNLNLMEWTLDSENLYENPIMNKEGKEKIIKLIKNKIISIKSLTGDCFMQNPFWKSSGIEREKLQTKFIDICKNSSDIGIEFIVIPLVDNGSLENQFQAEILFNFLIKYSKFFRLNNLKIVFESDLNPFHLKSFINQYPIDIFGINYDIGNSASLGYSPKKEFEIYGKRIFNVHIKDRLFKGTTVNLGDGDANFNMVFKNLKKINYKGNLILQTARSKEGNHVETILIYKKFIKNLITKYSLKIN